jgi:hypothetical protein
VGTSAAFSDDVVVLAGAFATGAAVSPSTATVAFELPQPIFSDVLSMRLYNKGRGVSVKIKG